MPDYQVGLDLGQSHDPSALVITERLDLAPDQPDQRVGERRDVIHAQRWPLGTPYPRLVDDVVALMDTDPLEDAALVIDATGVGRGITDMFREAHTLGRLAKWPVPVTITGGERASGSSIPKVDLISKLQAMFQSGRLLLAAGLPLADQLEKELLGFRAKVSPSGRLGFGAVTEQVHDDLVLALALAVWHPGRWIHRRYVGRDGRVYASRELCAEPW